MKIDLATAILILCKGWDTSFDVRASLEEIEKMVLELQVRINLEDNPKKIVSLINHYLFEKKSYSIPDSSDPGYMKLENSALSLVMENKKGNYLGLSLLYLTLTERLRFPFHGVAVPGHIFVCYDDGKKKINIETTEKGKEYEDTYYEKKFMLHPTYRNYNFYLRNLSKREVIAGFLSDIGVAYDRKGMHDEAIAKLKKAIEINPNLARAYHDLAITYYFKGEYSLAIKHCDRAIELGYRVSPEFLEVLEPYR